MIEFRWLREPDTTLMGTDRLQYRTFVPTHDANGNLSVHGAAWSEWKDVPVILNTQEGNK